MNRRNWDSSMRVIDILEVLKDNNTYGLSITEVSEKTGHSNSTVHRIMTALNKRGYIIRDDKTRKYKLGYMILQFTNVLMSDTNIKELARPYLEKLNRELKEAVHLILRSGNYGVYIDKIDSPHPIGLQVYIGKRIMLHSSAAGKVILAYMSKEKRVQILSEVGLPKFTDQTLVEFEKIEKELVEILNKGYAWNRGENRTDVYSIAAPIFDATGEVVGTLSLAGPSYRFNDENISKMVTTLTSTTRKLSNILGYLN